MIVLYLHYQFEVLCLISNEPFTLFMWFSSVHLCLLVLLELCYTIVIAIGLFQNLFTCFHFVWFCTRFVRFICFLLVYQFLLIACMLCCSHDLLLSLNFALILIFHSVLNGFCFHWFAVLYVCVCMDRNTNNCVL